MKTKKTKAKPIALDAAMPQRFADDHPSVTALIVESERVSSRGNAWLNAPIPNAVAAEMALRHGWAYSLAAAWLRCHTRGELVK